MYALAEYFFNFKLIKRIIKYLCRTSYEYGFIQNPFIKDLKDIQYRFDLKLFFSTEICRRAIFHQDKTDMLWKHIPLYAKFRNKGASDFRHF